MSYNSSGVPGNLALPTVRGLTIASYAIFGRIGFIVLALLLYCSSLGSETLKTTPDNGFDTLGIMVLAFGWFPFTTPPFVGTIAWLSNPELVAALVCLALGQYRITRIISIISLCGGCFTFLIWGVNDVNQPGEQSIHVVGYGIGVYLWFLSLAVPLLGANFLGLIPAAVPK